MEEHGIYQHSPLSPDFYYILSSSLGMYTDFFHFFRKKVMYKPGECDIMNHDQRGENNG
jgi:hypothetical protein